MLHFVRECLQHSHRLRRAKGRTLCVSSGAAPSPTVADAGFKRSRNTDRLGDTVVQPTVGGEGWSQMISETGAALTSIKTAMDMLKGVRALKSEADINLAVIDIQRTLLEAQAAAVDDKERQMGLLDRIANLEAKLAERQQWDEEKRRYRLTEFSEGRFAYVLISEVAKDEPSHKLCAKCYNEGRKSILQTVNKQSGGESVWCQCCREKTILAEFPKQYAQTVRIRRPWINY